MAMDTAKPALRGDAGRRLQDELLIDILDHAPDAIAIMEVVSAARHQYTFLYVNEAFEALYLCSKPEVVGADVVQFMSRGALAKDVEKTCAMLAEGKPFANTRLDARSGGRSIWLEVNFRPFIMEHQPLRWIFVVRDITAKKLLQDRATQLSIAVEEGNDLVAISVADETINAWRFTYVNEAFTRTTGYRPEEILGRTFASMMPLGRSPEDFAQIRGRLFLGEPVRDEVRFVHKNGRIGTFAVSSKPIADPVTGKFGSIVTIFRDVTEERAHEAQLQYEAEHDPLTGLHNRRYFERMLNDSIAMQRPEKPQHALVFLDLDRFKEVNDRLGHEAGDEVLKAAAAAFRRCIAGNDVLVRWGGDEFAAVLFHCHIASAQRTAQCMLEELLKTPAGYRVTASVGVAPVLPGEPAAESIKRVDGAAYSAKSGGGNRVVVA